METIGNTDFEQLRTGLKGELFTGKIRRMMLSTDASLYQIEPLAVVYPKDTQDVVNTVKFASNNGISVHARGAGSGLCGSAVGNGIVIDFTKYMNKLISLDIDSLSFTCEPGYRYGELERLLNNSGVFFPPAPSSGEYASFGGMYSTNAGGAYSVKYGNMADYLTDAEVVFSDGTSAVLNDIMSLPSSELPGGLGKLYDMISANNAEISGAYPDVPCNVCGYELRDVINNGRLSLHKLLGGAEGTLGIVTKLTFSLKKRDPYRTLIVAYFDDIVKSAKASQLALTMNPASIEIMDKSLLKIACENDKSLGAKIPQGHDNVLMIEFESDVFDEAEKVTKECMDKIVSEGLAANISLAVSEDDKEQFWAVRKAAVPILYLLRGEKKIVPLVEDAAVPVDRLVAYFEGLYEIFERAGVQFVLYGHIAKGLLHSRPLLNIKDKHDRSLLKVIADDVFKLVMTLGGTISGEHGDGRVRSSYIPKQYGEVHRYFIEVKKLLDPSCTFNPDIKTYYDDNQLSLNLRYDEDYKPVIAFEPDLIWEQDLALEIEKCHGCSKCTTVTSATRMCPMYKIYRDENSAPKAKANILRALISGKISDKALYEKAFKQVVDRCVNCGSCSRECPSRVNIPKLALEAKSQYVKKYGVTLENNLVTKFELFARYTRKLFPLVTPIMRFKAMRKVAEKIAGMSAEREFIKFNTKSVFDRYPSVIGEGSKKAIYFAGCYASYMRPEIAESTINILNKAGYQVLLPDQHCCGIPHISKGMAKGGAEKIEDNLRSWGKLLADADCVVVSCSSCGLSLTKEWGYLVGGELTDKIKGMTRHISEIIDENIDKLEVKGFGMSIAYHAPCHMLLMPDPSASHRVLSKIEGSKVVKMANSCCGMAGSWGISAKNYDESIKIGAAMAESLEKSDCGVCVTDCPTCEMQLNHLGDKPVYHPAEIFDKILSTK